MKTIKNKQMSSKSATFAKGGTGHMVGKQSAGPGGKGGKTKMFGKSGAMPAKSC